MTPLTSTLPSVVFPADDLDAAKKVYGALFGEPHTDTPYYVGYAVGDLQIGLNAAGHAQGMTGGVAYWPVEDVAAAVQALVEAGATVGQEPTAVGGGTTIATVTDVEGNTVGLIHAEQG